ncbi:MAG: DMT family transporter [candidate division WOR-3 bacterium]|nr:MAG: DMT family transporter [candidate division WOR-3 bacterium]
MFQYFGELAALGTASCWSFGSMAFTIASRRFGYWSVNILRLAVALILLVTAKWIITGSPFLPEVTAYHWFWFGLSGIIGFILGDTLLFKSFALIGARLAMLMMSLVPVFGTLIAWIFMNEILGVTKIIAILVTLSGITWVVLSKTNLGLKKHHYLIGIVCGIGGAAGQAIGLVLSKKGLVNGFSPLTGNIVRTLVASMGIWMIALFQGKIPHTVSLLKDKKGAAAMSSGAFLGPFLGVWLSLIAVQHTYVGIATTLMALPPVFLIPLSRWIFKERITTGAVLGTILAVSGVALIFLL